MAPKKGQRGKVAPKSQPPVVPGSDHIVFSNKPDSKKHEEKNDSPAAPRVDTRKIIGGASWTGKLPVNLLSEHCQRQKWNKPEYSMRQVPGPEGSEKLYRSSVTLSKTDPKTREMTKIPPFHLPASHVQLSDQPTALEARHFAATYALFRVCSMKNIHMTLPPYYRDLWKGPFQELKTHDTKIEDRSWKYDEDPFAAEVKGKEIRAAIEKRKEDQKNRDQKKDSVGITLHEPGGASGKAFSKAPRLDLGEGLRMQLEKIIRSHVRWNCSGASLSKSESADIIAKLTNLGFRTSHVREALAYCGSRPEVLEWLLIHVPEDDLPSWCLPQGYSTGVSLASSDLVKEAKLKRLTRAGYSTELCAQALRDNGGDEGSALEALQDGLIPPPLESAAVETVVPGDTDIWQEEMITLEATLDKKFTAEGEFCCAIASEVSRGGLVIFRFRKPSKGYPTSAIPIITIDSPSIPVYIRLSATKKAAKYAWESLLGDQMLYSLIEWLEASLPQIIEDPGNLVELDITSDNFQLKHMSSSTGPSHSGHRPRYAASDRRTMKDKRRDDEIKQSWELRQTTDAQKSMNVARQALPAWNKRSAIVQAVNKSQVTLITGDTGSGKSTQAIQFLLDDAIVNGKGATANLMCTQPRRVAALSLSDRVSAERCMAEGDEVGYIIRGDSKVSARTKITFMTTGVLLRQLQSSSGLAPTAAAATALRGISHIVVDEVHERSLDTDFLLALLRDALVENPALKVVLMSATVDAETFVEYFGRAGLVARVHIEGRTYPVQDLYLDDVLKLTGSGGLNDYDSESYEQNAGQEIRNLGMGINYNLIADIVQYIDRTLGNTAGGILVFLPGTLEIDKCLRAVGDLPNVLGLPLHASLMPAEQRRVFPAAPKGKRKVIAATNVAETSITIEDIVAVIDTGRVKETNYDILSNIVRLQEVWASQAACKQRRGRAGRVRAGTCYKLFTRNAEASMKPAAAPEMHRVPLEQLCLSVKATGSGRDVADFLARTISPPDSSAVANAMRGLHRMGALENDRLTGLGTYMTMIPADLRCAKLLVYGSLFGCVEACLTLAAILTVKSPFVSPRDKREESKEARASFPGTDGDLLLDLAAFDRWRELSAQTPLREMYAWCSSKFLSQHTLRDIESTRRQLLDSLKETALVPSTYSSASANKFPTHQANNDNSLLLRALVAGALNPQIAAIQLPDKKFIASMSGAKELDPDARTIKYVNEENGRVFVHPSSVLFDAQGFTGAATYVSYFTKMATSKTFIRDLTPLNAYSLLLFGGVIEVDTTGAGLVVDGWLKLRGWARIGVLVSRLRTLLDEELRKRIDNAGVEADDNGVIGVVRRLVELNGQDQ